MRAVVTRVTGADVAVDGEVVGKIGPGLLVLLGAAADDEESDAVALARKVARLRIFADDHRPLNRSVIDVRGEALVVSQFTLLADTSKGRRPSLIRAGPADRAEQLYEEFVRELGVEGVPVATGRFGATMQVSSVNDGPVTLILSTKAQDTI